MLSQAVEWARSVKRDLVELEQLIGIPALFAVAQMVHEGFDSDGTMTTLARDHFNFGGMKWAEWQGAFGCSPVSFDSPEEIDGVWTMVNGQAFCSCPSWKVWLVVYASLLHDVYSECFAYKSDPLLFGFHVGRKWATDSRYVGKIAQWMTWLWDEYADTLAPKDKPAKLVLSDNEYATGVNADGNMVGLLRPLINELVKLGWVEEWDGLNMTMHLSPPVNVNVTVDGSVVECNARLVANKTVVELKPVVHAMGANVGWSAKTRTASILTRHLDTYPTR